MSKSAFIKVDRYMRQIHLYTGLFLIPWMIVYALSAFSLNHHKWMAEKLAIQPAKWKQINSVEYRPNDDFPSNPEAQGRYILQYLELDGVANVQQRPFGLFIVRPSAKGNYRIIWNRNRNRITVEQMQPFSAYRLIHALHFKHGYRKGNIYWNIWGFIVDLTAISIIFWAISGVYIWARRPSKRLLGGILLLSGFLLFIILIIEFWK